MTSVPSVLEPATDLEQGRLFLRIALVVGLLLRAAILWQTTNLGVTIVDEQQYSQIADNLLAGNGFAWHPGDLTSIRPPLFPAMVAAIWAVAGPRNLQAVRAVQIVLALALAGAVYLLGARAYSRAVGRYAAAVCWLYPSFIFFNFLILTETLFTLLLVVFLLCTVLLVQTPRASWALLCGVSLGLAALTRSVLWPLPIVLCPMLAVLMRAPLVRRIGLPLLVVAGYALVVAPWAIRNTRLQGVVTVVDTMGGMNLRMGNYEYTPDDRMWDAVGLTGDKSWIHGIGDDLPGPGVTEGMKEKWAQKKALQYMRAHPGVTVRRSLIKFADLWGLEREFMAGVRSGLFAPPAWFAVLGSICIIGAYVAVSLAGAVGIWLAAPADWRMQVVLLLPVLVIVAGHTIVFGHSRYHMPLVPVLAIYGTALVAARWPVLGWRPAPAAIGAAATVTALMAIWVRQVVFVDLARIGSLLHNAG
ncbi:MAG: glycosyltransferase family 39 protein [Acidobacteriota bacterium]